MTGERVRFPRIAAARGALARRLAPEGESGRMVRGVALLLRGTLIAQLIGVLSMPILSRWFPVEAFGQFQLYQSIVTIALVAASMRYELAILSARNLREVGSIAQLCVAINLVTASVAGLLLAGVMMWPGLVDSSGWVINGWLLALAVLISGVVQMLNYLVTRFGAFAEGGNSRIVQAATATATPLAIGIVKPVTTGLILGDIAGKSLAAVQLTRVAARRGVRFWPPLSRRRLATVAWRYRHYALVSVPNGVLSATSGAMASIMILTTYGAQVTGQFGLVERTMTLAVNTAAQTLAQVFTTRLSELVRQGELRQARVFFRRTMGAVALLALPPCIVLAVIAPQLFKIVFGAQWALAGEIGQIMALYYYVSVIQGVAMFSLMTLQRQRTQFLWDVGRLPSLVVAWVVIRALGLGPLAGISIHFAIMFLFCLIFVWLVDRELGAAGRRLAAPAVSL
jgi:teichuronic acid exporter